MTIHQGGLGLPEDRIVNTMHFQSLIDTDFAGDAAVVDEQVLEFWQGAGVGPLAQSQPIEAYLSPWIQGAFEIRVYDLREPKPRVPVIFSHTQATFAGSSGMPEEVACVATFYGAPPITRRRRGRLYLGPLNNTGVTVATGPTAPSRPSTGLISDLTKACQTLSVSLIPWCVRSELPTENFVQIVGGYVDNALDTQRRRGPDTTARTVWNSPAV